MVRRTNKIVAPPRTAKVNTEKTKTKTKKPASKKVYRYMRKCDNVEVSGPTRMHKFARACLIAQNNSESPYTASPGQEHFLNLDSVKGITKLTLAANKELCNTANHIIRSLVSRACMLVNATHTSKGVTVASLHIVNNFFTAV